MESSSPSNHVITDVMSKHDLLRVLQWAAQEGWNPGRGDADLFQMADPEGFFMSKTAEDGEPVAAVSAVRYGDNYGFIGLYICANKFRGRGHGLTIFEHAMQHLEGRVIGLEAVAAQQSNYSKQGFVMAFETVRVRGDLDVALSSNPKVEQEDGEGCGRHGLVLQAVNADDEDLVEMVSAYDELHTPAPRRGFTRAWLTAPGHIARVAIKDGVVKGYGVLRPCTTEGAKIAPLFASSVDVAEHLAREILSAASVSCVPPPDKVFIDIPEPNKEGMLMAGRLGLSELWKCGRMYKGSAPKLPLDQIFGFTSLELG